MTMQGSMISLGQLKIINSDPKFEKFANNVTRATERVLEKLDEHKKKDNDPLHREDALKLLPELKGVYAEVVTLQKHTYEYIPPSNSKATHGYDHRNTSIETTFIILTSEKIQARLIDWEAVRRMNGVGIDINKSECFFFEGHEPNNYKALDNSKSREFSLVHQYSIEEKADSNNNLLIGDALQTVIKEKIQAFKETIAHPSSDSKSDPNHPEVQRKRGEALAEMFAQVPGIHVNLKQFETGVTLKPGVREWAGSPAPVGGYVPIQVWKGAVEKYVLQVNDQVIHLSTNDFVVEKESDFLAKHPVIHPGQNEKAQRVVTCTR